MTSKPADVETAPLNATPAETAAQVEVEKKDAQATQGDAAPAPAAAPVAATESNAEVKAETAEKKDEPVEKKLEDLSLAEKKEEPVVAAQEEKKDEPAVAAQEEKKEEPAVVAQEEKKEEPAAAAPAAEAPVPAPAAPVVEAPAPAAPAASETPAPATPTPEKATGEPVWPETGAEHPLTKFFEAITELTTQANHNEIWGITLSQANAFQTKLILQKFLRANANDLAKAKEQLLETLKWRKEFDPVAAASATYSKERFDGLGYIMEIESVPESANKKDVVTFNIYGAVKDNQKTFGDLEGFLKWRVGLMERSVQKLNLAAATKPIPDFGQGPDPYQGFQVHDYLQVSFLRQDPVVKAATKKVIETLGRFYPETLSRKFFVNVPLLMGWVFSAVKIFVAKETVKKFNVLSYGNQLAAELGQALPKEYGGSAGELKNVGEGVALE